MALISTTAPGMVQAANAMDSTISQTNSGVATVSSSVAGLQATWQGEAGNRFVQAMHLWEEDSHQIVKALGEMVALLHSNRQVITSGEESNASLAANIPTGPGLPI